MTTPASLGKHINRLRHQSGLTQAEVATRMGTTTRDVYRLEGAYRGTMPTLRTVMKLARALDCSIGDITSVLEAK